jgi:DNA replication protein DnaC
MSTDTKGFAKHDEETSPCRQHGIYTARGYACVNRWSDCPTCREQDIRRGLKEPADGEERTETCEKHGQFIATHKFWRFGAHSYDHWSECPGCEIRAKLEREAAEKQRQRDEATARRVDAVKIPVRFANKTLVDYEVSCPGEQNALTVATDYVRNFEENRKAGRCLVFLGKVGTGKTHLGCGIARAVAQDGWGSRYTTVRDLIRKLRASWENRPISTVCGQSFPESESEVLRKFSNDSLLILDEVGVQSGSDLEVTQLTEVLDLRYRALRPTVIISNCTKDELKRYLGDRTVDLLRENGGKVVTFEWPSHRGWKAAEVLTRS